MLASVHQSIAEIDAAEWDALSGPGRLFQSHAWLKAIEGGAMHDYAPRYILLRDGSGRIAATAAAFIMPTSLITLSSGPVKSAVDAIRRRLPRFLKPRILECGSPLGPGCGVSIRPGLNLADIAPTLSLAFDRLAASEQISLIALRDFVDTDFPEASTAFAPHGYTGSMGFPTMSLQVTWGTYDRYLRALSSRHRQKVKRGLSLAQKAGLSVRWTTIGETGSLLANERENVRSLASEYSREQVTAQFFDTLETTYGSAARVLEVMSGQTRVGHALVIDDGTVLRWLSFGRAERGARDGAYFLVIASIIQLAIREGKSVIDMGITTEGPKSDFGAEIIPQWMLLRLRGPLGKLLPFALKYVTPDRAKTARHAFRNET